MASKRFTRSVTLLAFLICVSVVATDRFDGLFAQSQPPTVATDKSGYLLGEQVVITGAGFDDGEAVTLQIAEVNGAAYEPIALQADAGGRISVSWTLADLSARALSIVASGEASGASAAARIDRVALISTDKYDYHVGDVVMISGEGFDPAETVTIQVQHSNDLADSPSHLPFAAIADADGRVSASWGVTTEDARDSIFRITATGADSSLVATTTFTDPPATFPDTAGVDDVAGAADLSFYQFENFNNLGGAPALALAWGLDDTAFAAGVQACAQIDTNGDGLSNRMICVTTNGNPPVVGSSALYACANSSFGCDSPTPIAAIAGTITASTAPSDPFGGAHACSGTNCTSRDTVVNVTLRTADLGGSPGSAVVTNVCTDSDCGVPVGSGFLSINKIYPPEGPTNPFTFNLGAGQSAANGQSSWTITSTRADIEATTNLIAIAPGTYSVYEQIPSGWQLKDASCRLTPQTLPAFPVLGPASAGVENFTVFAGRPMLCKFVNETGVPADPKLELIKLVNGEDANSPTGPVVPVGSTVNYTFTVTNTGNIQLAPVTITDDEVGEICTINVLAANATQTCTATGIAKPGQHVDIGTAIGLTSTKTPVSDTDLGHYFGAEPGIALVKRVNGDDANVPTGPLVSVGSAVSFTFQVSNTGNVALAPVVVTDNVLGNVCTIASLAAGASQTCTVSAPAAAGQHSNIATATGTPPAGGDVSASDPGNYFGVSAGIDLVKLVNGDDANAPTGPVVAVGSTVTFTFRVTNTSNVALAEVRITDDVLGTICTIASLAPGASQTCTATQVATAGQHADIGTATGVPPNKVVVTDSDPGHYFGNAPSITLVKLTNGTNNNSAPGPSVFIGSPVTWTYTVTNNGNVALTNVVVRDDNGTPATLTDDFTVCAIASLAAGASQSCTATRNAISGQYENWATATGSAGSIQVTAKDLDHYYGKPTTATCVAQYVSLNAGSSSTSGTPGNIRTLNGSNVSVKASAFSRAKSTGSWATAFLGTYGAYGLGVTDGSEGSGSDNRHKVDNIGDRLNFVLFEFSKPVVITRAYLAYVGDDSDVTFWIGNKTTPYTNHNALSDAFLSSLGAAQTNLAYDGADRWASFNNAGASGNILVIAADPGDTTPDDAFKLAKLDLCVPSSGNQPPDAKNDSLKTLKNTSKTITVLANDTDPEGNPLSVVSVTQPGNGSVVLNSNGTVKYIPPYNWVGTTSFTYKITDGNGGTDTAVVSVTVAYHYYGDNCGQYHEDDDGHWWDDDDNWWKYHDSGTEAHSHNWSGVCYHWSHYKTWW